MKEKTMNIEFTLISDTYNEMINYTVELDKNYV